MDNFLIWYLKSRFDPFSFSTHQWAIFRAWSRGNWQRCEFWFFYGCHVFCVIRLCSSDFMSRLVWCVNCRSGFSPTVIAKHWLLLNQHSLQPSKIAFHIGIVVALATAAKEPLPQSKLRLFCSSDFTSRLVWCVNCRSGFSPTVVAKHSLLLNQHAF